MGLKLPAAVLLSQVAKLGSLLILFLLVLLVPAFLRVPYCYLLFNAIVLALGIQAGLLRRGSAMTSSDPIADEDRHLSSQTGQAVTPVSILVSPIQRAGLVHPNDQTAVADDRAASAFGASNIVDLKTKTKKVVLTMLMKKCPSAASIFFLSALNGSRVSGEEQASEEKQEDRKLDVEMTRQELFANTERFIGNFRKELRMQRQ
ncbi:hypothetical protein CFC21_089208 [Triticum aestivum]|uniref:DUF4408 domain-containing protein n=3 Tax=Triticum TaxID=4564 RepID=A0A9R0YTG1_TRITD|nr:uncharacterized protein LOC119320485 [Triticum dicoccoides]XP_044409705.1 uncharacterized protein LOC123134528 [Triticum aestivum]KAF7085830.1 hypothetical protein CFC21_089208 [Triticum aestivum]VAI60754.1 unnamed protein product [Triticum turgidum subsp. durum]